MSYEYFKDMGLGVDEGLDPVAAVQAARASVSAFMNLMTATVPGGGVAYGY